ncbi:hypothetical protein [uncultured Vagococcus sp.]|uniref:hypothetical protein n=1 Tax=uncultured Vagococcus sp. TaxID=189676 RepID=UPI0028D30EE4|nr:hypothetical protein [uncultured Vagococcus sp.]
MIAKVDLISAGVPYAVKGLPCTLVKKRARHTEFNRVIGEGKKAKVLSFRVENDLVPIYFSME